MKTTRTVKYCEVTVRRPNGEVETIRHPKVTEMTPAIWEQFCRAMAGAGKGDGISYDNRSEEVPLTLEEQREELTWELSAALDRSEAAMRKAHATSVGGTELARASEAVQAAEAAIAAFDAEHPEIITAIKAKRAENADRHMWD